MSESDPTDLQPNPIHIDPSLPAIELPETWQLGPGRLLPAHPHRYPRQPSELAQTELPARDSEVSDTAAATNYLATILPDVQATVLSERGHSAVVLTDGTYAYKILRSPRAFPEAHMYSSVENEAAMLHVLGRVGIMPNLVALIDAAMPFRYDRTYYRGEGKDSIVRVTSDGCLPVVVSEKIDAGSIDELPRELYIPEFRRLAAAALDLGIVFGDPHLFYDRQHNRVVALDAGEYAYFDHLPSYAPGTSDKEACIISEILRGFGTTIYVPRLMEISAIFEQDGLAGFDRFLLGTNPPRRRG